MADQQKTSAELYVAAMTAYARAARLMDLNPCPGTDVWESWQKQVLEAIALNEAFVASKQKT